MKSLRTALLTVFTQVSFVFADGTLGSDLNPLKYDTIQAVLAAILSVVVQVATPFVVLAVIWCGFLLVTARGNPEKIKKAKDALFYTIIGAVLMLGAAVLSSSLSDTITQITK